MQHFFACALGFRTVLSFCFAQYRVMCEAGIGIYKLICDNIITYMCQCIRLFFSCLSMMLLVCVCRYTCLGLFECHKPLFSFHMCAKILEMAGKLNREEYSFFLLGGLVSCFVLSQTVLFNISLLQHDTMIYFAH